MIRRSFWRISEEVFRGDDDFWRGYDQREEEEGG